MRLIDADELLKSFVHCSASFDEGDFPIVENVINQAPTVDPWHYPSKGELPKESGVYLVKVNYHDGKTSPFMSLCEYDTKYSKWFFYGNKDIVAWQDIYPTSEEG